MYPNNILSKRHWETPRQMLKINVAWELVLSTISLRWTKDRKMTNHVALLYLKRARQIYLYFPAPIITLTIRHSWAWIHRDACLEIQKSSTHLCVRRSLKKNISIWHEPAHHFTSSEYITSHCHRLTKAKTWYSKIHSWKMS